LGHISLTRKIVSEMTYIVSSGTLNPTIPYSGPKMLGMPRRYTRSHKTTQPGLQAHPGCAHRVLTAVVQMQMASMSLFQQ